MKHFKITVYVLGTIILMIITGYLLSRVNLDGLNTERSILLQVIDKDRMLERKLRDQNTSLHIKLSTLTDKITVSKEFACEDDSPRSAVNKSGNRGFFFQNPRYTGQQGEE